MKALSTGLALSFLFFGGVACSSKKTVVIKKEQKEDSGIFKNKKDPVISGPTKPNPKGPFKNVTNLWGLQKIKAAHLYAVDWNNDSYTDLVVLSDYYDVPRFYKYHPRLKKFIFQKNSPLEKTVRASFLAFEDFNKDGLLDCIVATLNQKTEITKRPLRLYLSKKKKDSVQFIEQKDAFPEKVYPTSSLGILDYDMDGYLDLYLGNWFDFSGKSPTPLPDRIYKGKGTSFQDVSYLLEGELKFDKNRKLHVNARPTFGVSVCDVDQNGFPDILGASSSRFANRLYLNLYDRKNKDRVFKDYGPQSGLAFDDEGAAEKRGGGNSFYANCNDYNNDGIMDVALGELFHSYDPESQDRSSILTGSRVEFPPKFLRTEYHKDDGSGSWSQGDRRSLWFDYNFDGLLDLMVENSGFPPHSRLILFHQESDHAYIDMATDYGLDILNPSGGVYGDFDKDGKVDFIVGQTNVREKSIEPRIYAYSNNQKANGRTYFKVLLKGKRANTRGIGSTVMIYTNKRMLKRNVSLLEGSLPSQNAEGLFIGLLKGEKIKKVEIRWPYLVKKGESSYPLYLKYRLNHRPKAASTLYFNDAGKWWKR